MKVCVQGLWHLGSVTAAFLASVVHQVIGLDPSASTIDGLRHGRAPLFEPGLDDLLQSGITTQRLQFTERPADAVSDAEVLWVAFDTPVDDEDQADVEYVVQQILLALPELAPGAVILVSSQMPVGSIKRLEAYAAQNFPSKQFEFACSPENLRLGKALEVFLKPDRIIVGVRTDRVQQILNTLLSPVTERIEWMSVESAEMTKHAINAFLATSVTFANEIASICELVGADAKQVERGLKTEARIGPKAYLSPGGPFAGGTLARDIEFLGLASRAKQLATPLLSSVGPSNDAHKNWVRRKLSERFANLRDTTVVIWGLTYKVGTDTLRRSLAVELCDWLLEQGAKVRVHDPIVQNLPERWVNRVVSYGSALEAVAGADAMVVGAEWPEFRQAALQLLEITGPQFVVIDASRYLQAALASSELNYIAVGTPSVSQD